jgi:hypothetical protein
VKEPFVVAFEIGVTPTKWARIWDERMPTSPLTLRPLSSADAHAALRDGSAHVALLRLPPAGAAWDEDETTRSSALPLAGTTSASALPLAETTRSSALPRPTDAPVTGPISVWPEELSAIPLYEEELVVVAPKGHEVEALDSVELADLSSFRLLDQDWADAIDLVAANVGLAVMPHSVARARSRRDVITRPVTDAASTTVALVWVTANTTPLIEEFIGIVRGRTANSSRGVARLEPEGRAPAAAKAAPRPIAARTNSAATRPTKRPTKKPTKKRRG